MKNLFLFIAVSVLISSCTQTKFTSRETEINTINTTHDCENLYSTMQILNYIDFDTNYNYFKNHKGQDFAKIYTAPQGDHTDSVIISLEDFNTDELSQIAGELEDTKLTPTYFVSCKFNVNYTKYNVTNMCEPSTGGNLIIGPEVLRQSNFDLNQKIIVADDSTNQEFIGIFPTYLPEAQMGMKKADVILLISGKNGKVIGIADNPYVKCRDY